MVKYAIEKLQAMVGVKPTFPIDKIHDRPTFSTLWNIQCQLVGGLQKLVSVKYPLDVNAG